MNEFIEEFIEEHPVAFALGVLAIVSPIIDALFKKATTSTPENAK